MKTISSANAAAAASGMTPNVKAVLYPRTGSALALTGSDFFGTGMSFSSGTTPEETFEVGACVIGGLKFSLNNMQRRFSTFNFAGAYIDPELYYDDMSDTIPMGRFYFQMHRDLGDTIRCETFDALKLMDEQRASITFPATAAQIVQALATANDISVYSLNFNGASTTIQNPNTAMSQRQLLSYVMQLTGNYAIMRSDKKLHIEWYQANPTQVEMPIFDQQLSTADIEVTGVEVFPIDTPETAVDLGTEEYVVTVKDNPLITSSNSSAAAYAVFSQVYGVRFRPGFIVGLANPAIEAGDMISFQDLNSNTIRFLVTNLRFQPSNLHETYQSDAEEFGSSDLRPNTAGRIRYTWYAYADDVYGANISLSPDGKDYIGIAPNRLTETPDITNPAVYTWSLIKGSTPVIDATKEGGTTTITVDGEPIAEIEDGNGIASKTDYYMLADTMVSNDLATAKTHLPHSEEGPIVSFSDGMGGIPFEAMMVSILPLQSGTGDPSPTNIRPVSGWTGARINIVAKNIFDEEAADWKNGYYIDASGVETSHSSYKYSQTYVRVKPSTTYAVQINKGVNTSLAVSVPYYDEDLNFISRESAISSTSAEGVLTGSFTTPDGCAYIRINLPKTDTTDIQVEEASSATEYEAFSGAYPVLWETEAGTVYFGTLDPLKGILTVTHGYIEIDGSKSVNAVENHPGCFSYSLGGDALHPVSKAETSTGWCSHYKVLTNLTAAAFYSSEYATAYAHSGLTNTVGRAFFSDPRYSEAADFKAYLEAQAQNGTPVQYVFRLETPVQYQLAPAQIEQLAGKNTVWADAGEISLTYYDEAAASWGTDPLEPNAYSKFLWWKYGTTYTDDPSAEVISDPAIIGVYNLDWLEDTQKAKDAADVAAGMAEGAAKNAADNSERLTKVESETSTLAGKANSASQDIISLKTRAELLEEFQKTADRLLKQLEAEQGDVSSWLEFDRNAGLLIGSQDEGHAADYIVQINGACISFYENRQAAKAGTEAKRVAYFQNHNLYVDNAWVGGYFNMGKFRFVNQTTGNMSLVWTGE